jgi:hypothetical protein
MRQEPYQTSFHGTRGGRPAQHRTHETAPFDRSFLDDMADQGNVGILRRSPGVAYRHRSQRTSGELLLLDLLNAVAQAATRWDRECFGTAKT